MSGSELLMRNEDIGAFGSPRFSAAARASDTPLRKEFGRASVHPAAVNAAEIWSRVPINRRFTRSAGLPEAAHLVAGVKDRAGRPAITGARLSRSPSVNGRGSPSGLGVA